MITSSPRSSNSIIQDAGERRQSRLFSYYGERSDVMRLAPRHEIHQNRQSHEMEDEKQQQHFQSPLSNNYGEDNDF